MSWSAHILIKTLQPNLKSFTTASEIRGRDYFLDGRVHGLSIVGKTATAEVEGSSTYHVEATFGSEGEIIRHSCDCPYNKHGLCKHLAALLYAVDADGGLPEKGDELPRQEPGKTGDYVRDLTSEFRSVTTSGIPAFYVLKEDEFLKEMGRWDDEEKRRNLRALYTLNIHSYYGTSPLSRLLDFARENPEIRPLLGDVLPDVYARWPFKNAMEEAFIDEELRSEANRAFRNSLKGEANAFRNAVYYDIYGLVRHFEEESVVDLVSTVRFGDVSNYDLRHVLEVTIEKNQVSALKAFAGSPLIERFPNETLLELSSALRKNGLEKESRSVLRSALEKGEELPFSFYIEYWESLTEDERKAEAGTLSEAAIRSGHEKAWRIYMGESSKADVKGLPLREFQCLEKEIRSRFSPADYVKPLSDKARRRLLSQNLYEDEFIDIMKTLESFPEAARHMVRNNPEVLSPMLESGRRSLSIPVLRDAGVLDIARIYRYGGQSDVS